MVFFLLEQICSEWGEEGEERNVWSILFKDKTYKHAFVVYYRREI